MSQFRAATLKLTAWYLVILMAVSVSFSVVIYTISAHELDRPFPVSSFGRTFLDEQTIRMIREARATEGKRSLVVNLTILNLATLALGACASYYSAKRTLSPIEEAMESQSRFVSDASHELRTPLAVIRTENEIALRTKHPSVGALKDTLVSNLEEIDRLQLLTDRLLALSSQQTVPLEAFQIEDAVQEAASRHALAAKQKDIQLDLQLTPTRAIGDLDTVCDLISILIDNAIKYSPESSVVTITTSEQNRRVVVSVADEGDGVKDEDKARIFERFYRADESRSKQNVEGHGLGLALAKRLSELNRAHLAVIDARAHGAVFTLELDKA